MNGSRTHLLIWALVALAVVNGGCGSSDGQGGSSERAPTARTADGQSDSARTEGRPGQQRGPLIPPAGKAPPVAFEVATGVGIAEIERRRAVMAARRFAVSLTAWLYGDRGRLEVEPVTERLSREIGRDPPADIPADQRRSGEGRIRSIALALQTATSGALVVTVNDLRTDITLFAQIERVGGRWLITAFNDH